MTSAIFVAAFFAQLMILAVPLMALDRVERGLPVHRAPVYSLLIVNFIAYLGLSQIGFALNGWQHRRGASLLGAPGEELVFGGQAVLLVFLAGLAIGVACGRLAVPVTRPIARDPVNTTERVLSLTSLGLGAAASFWLFSSLSGLRSSLVASASGQVLYAMSFFLTTGALVLALRAWHSKRRLEAIAYILLASVSLGVLGGRGRILWLALGAWLGFRALERRAVSFRTALVAGVSLLVALFVLDAAFFALLAEGGDVRGALERLAIAAPSMATSPGFDAFDNLVLVMSRPHDLMPELVAGGSRRYFMMEHFPAAYLAGVGFPISLPGELWLMGRTVGVILGGFALGSIVGALDALATRSPRVVPLAGVLAVAPWIAGVGSAYLEHTGKLVAAAFPAILLTVAISQMHGRPAETEHVG